MVYVILSLNTNTIIKECNGVNTEHTKYDI